MGMGKFIYATLHRRPYTICVEASFHVHQHRNSWPMRAAMTTPYAITCFTWRFLRLAFWPTPAECLLNKVAPLTPAAIISKVTQGLEGNYVIHETRHAMSN